MPPPPAQPLNVWLWWVFLSQLLPLECGVGGPWAWRATGVAGSEKGAVMSSRVLALRCS